MHDGKDGVSIWAARGGDAHPIRAFIRLGADVLLALGPTPYGVHLNIMEDHFLITPARKGERGRSLQRVGHAASSRYVVVHMKNVGFKEETHPSTPCEWCMTADRHSLRVITPKWERVK